MKNFILPVNYLFKNKTKSQLIGYEWKSPSEFPTYTHHFLKTFIDFPNSIQKIKTFNITEYWKRDDEKKIRKQH